MGHRRWSVRLLLSIVFTTVTLLPTAPIDRLFAQTNPLEIFLEPILHEGEICLNASWHYSRSTGPRIGTYSFRLLDLPDGNEVAFIEASGTETANLLVPHTSNPITVCYPSNDEFRFRIFVILADSGATWFRRTRDARLPASPQAPSGLSHTPPTSVDVPSQLTWDALEEGAPRGYWEITGYDVQFRIGSEEEWHDVDPPHMGTERRYDDNRLWKVHSTVHFRVRATNTATELKPTEPAPWSEPITADNLPVLDLDADSRFSDSDVVVMYYSYSLPGLVGSGSEGTGFSEFRSNILRSVPGLTESTESSLLGTIARAHQFQRDLRAMLLDINQSGQLTADDALIMYYAYTFSELLGNGDSGGTVDFRRTFLAGLAGISNPTDADLRDLLKRANALQAE